MRIGLEFAKTGAARYISHLDLQRAFSRAIRRSGLPVKLSEGFNPHYVVSFASALALGMESLCECVEMALAKNVTAEEFLLRMAKALPPGLEARRAVVLAEGAPAQVITEQVLRDAFRLEAVVVPDPVTGGPMIVPGRPSDKVSLT